MKRHALLLLLSFMGFGLHAQMDIPQLKTSFGLLRKPDFVVKSNKRKILIGDTIYIAWNSRKMDSIIFLNTKERLQMKGFIALKPDADVKYDLLAYKKGEIIKKQIRIQVLKPAILKILAPDSVMDGIASKLSWITENASKVILNPGKRELSANGEIMINPDSTTQYYLTAVNKNDFQVTQTIDIKVHLDEYLIGDTNIIAGDTAKINWKFKFCKEIRILGSNKTFNNVDSLCFNPQKDTVLQVIAIRNNGDSVIKKHKLKVSLPKIEIFTGSKLIYAGQNATLSWKAKNIDSVHLEGYFKAFPANGSLNVSPDVTTTYVVYIENNGIREKKSFTVNVIQRAFVKGTVDFKDLAPNSRIDFEIFASDVSKYPDSVTLYVLAVDEKGNFVRGLAPPFGNEKTSQKYFKSLVEIYRNGPSNEIKTFSVIEIRNKKRINFDINLTLDYSGSMDGQPILDLEKAVKQLIEKKDDRDRLSIVRFDDSVVREVPLIRKKEDILENFKFNAIDDFGGMTALYAAADEGLNTLKDSKNQRHQILFTDGYENSSFLYWQTHAFNAQMLAVRAKLLNTRINICGIGYSLNQPLLKYLAMLTGGNYYNVKKTDEIKDIFGEMPYLNRNYYRIQYIPPQKDGERIVQLIFNNNKGNNIGIRKTMFIGNNFDLNEMDYDKAGYWNKYKKLWSNMTPIISPQAVALFDFNKYEFHEQYKPNLDFYIKYLKNHPQSKAIIFGHTDCKGTDEYCNELSLNRANEIADAMLKANVKKEQLIVVPCGKNHPIWNPEQNEIQAQENRRVEIMLVE